MLSLLARGNVNDNKDLKVYCPKDVTVAVQGTARFPVQIQRRGFSGQVILNFLQFPDGLTIVEQDRSIPEGKTKATFTLKASYMAKGNAFAIGNGLNAIDRSLVTGSNQLGVTGIPRQVR